MANEFVVKNGLITPTVQLPGATSGTVTISAPAVAGTTSIALPATAGTIVTTGDTGTVTNTMLAGSIANNKLVNSTISGTALGSTLPTLTLSVSGTGLAGSATYNATGAATFTVTSNATSANTASTIVARDASGNFVAGTITAALVGNASTATTLQTARTISLSGDVVGSVSFDGSGNAAISTTIQPDSVALGTDTTGNYMVNVTAGTGVSVSHTQGEGSTATVSIGQPVGTTDNVTFNNVTVNGTLTSDDITSANINVTGNATITGNLTVSGTTTTVNSTTVALADLNLELARNAANAAQANGAGITVTGPTTAATFTYTSADDRWNLNKNLNVTTVFGALSGNATTASTWQTARTLSFTGDATGSMSVNGSADVSAALTLANSGVTAGTYNNVTVNSKGLVTSGSNVAYLTSYSESDTLATVTARGNSTSASLALTGTNPISLQGNSNNATYTQSVIYANQNNTSANDSNGIFIERGRITDSASAEIRNFVIGARGGQIQWKLDGSGNTSQTGYASLTSNSAQLRLSRTDASGPAWSFYSWASGLNIFPATASTIWIGRDGGSTDMQLYNGNLYAPIMYDTNNTAYYVDPNGGSQVSGNRFYFGTHGSLYDDGNFHIDGHSSPVWINSLNSSTIELNTQTSGYVNIGNSARAPIFYDSANTSYYVDPNSTSNLVGLTVANTITGSITGTAGGETLATVTGRGGSTSNSVTLSSMGNQFGGHFYFLAYDAAGNHYPHFNDGGSASGSKVNWRLYTGGTNSVTHYWGTDTAQFVTKLESTVRVDAPIFYDRDNTAYYADPNSVSNMWALKLNRTTDHQLQVARIRGLNTDLTGDYIHMYERVHIGYPSGWGGIDAPSYGLSTWGQIHWNRSMGASNWGYGVLSMDSGWGGTGNYPTIGSAGSSSGSLIMLHNPHIPFRTDNARSGASGRSGMRLAIDTAGSNWWDVGLYGDAFEIFRNASTTQQFWIDSSGNNYARSSFRAPIFYDSGDTNYYVDAASTSRLNVVHANYYFGEITDSGNGDSNAPYRFESDYSGWVSFLAGTVGSSNGWGTFWAGNDNPAYYYFGTSNPNEYVFVGNGGVRASIDLDDGNSYFAGSVRSPIFYDSNDTAYYVDPNSTSRLLTIRNSRFEGTDGTFVWRVGSGSGTTRHINLSDSSSDPSAVSVNSGITWGERTDNYPYYLIYAKSQYNNGYSNHTRLTLAWHTGIEIGAASSYGGTRFFNNSPFTGSDIFSVGKGDNHVRVENNLYAPILYDLNNTGYYVDPASTDYSARLAGNLYFTSYPKIGIEDAGMDCYLYITDQNPTIDGIGYGGEFYFYGDKSISSSYLNFGGAIVENILRANSSLRAPIFYDSNDTNYYLDPASSSKVNHLLVNGGNARASYISGTPFNWTGSAAQYFWNRVATLGYEDNIVIEIVAKTDFNYRPMTIAIASFNTWNGTHFSVKLDTINSSDITIDVAFDNSNQCWVRAFVSWNCYLKWRIIHNSGATIYESGVTYQEAQPTNSIVVGTGQQVRGTYGNVTGASVTTGDSHYVSGLTARSDVRAPIFYDSNDTGYYLDPNSTGVALRIAGAIQGNHVAWTGEHNKIQWHSAHMYFQNMSDGYWIFRRSNGSEPFQLHADGWGQASGDWRAPRFYDSNDTAYYTDPASTSNLVGLTVANTITGSISGNAGNTSSIGNATGGSYTWTGVQYFRSNLGSTSGSLSDPPLQAYSTNNNSAFMSFHKGGYYAVNMGLDSDNVLRIGGWSASANRWELNMGGDNTVAGSFRAPIFYDSNDTGYYADPASTSNMYKVTAYQGARYQSTDWADAFRNTPVSSRAFHGDVSSGGPQGTWWFYDSMRHSNSSNYWGTQIAYGWEDNANEIWQRNITGNSFSGWVRYLNSSNYNSYAPTLTGGNASGTWGINITGSAGSVPWSGVTSKPSLWYQSGSWLGDLGSNGFTRENGVSMTGGAEFVVLSKSGQGYTLVDGSYYAYESGGFYSSQNSAYGTLLGFYADTTTSLNFNTTSVKLSGNQIIHAGNKDSYTYPPASHTHTFDSLTSKTSGTGTYQTSGDFRAPIFYDSVTTAYYVDPGSTSNLNRVQFVNGKIKTEDNQSGNSVDLYFRPNNDDTYVWRHIYAGTSSGYGTGVGGYGVYCNHLGGDYSAIFNTAGFVTFPYSARAPIFYDSNDTAYYLDPSSTGTSINIRGAIISGASGGTGGGSLTLYGVYGSFVVIPSTQGANSFIRSAAGVSFQNSSATTTYMTIDSSGNVTATGNVTAYSDIRLKTDVQPIENAIDKVKQINGVTYTRKENNKRQTGVIAQDVLKVLPEAVEGSEEGMYSVAYGNMVGLLVEAIKEQQSEIDELKALVRQLLAK